jgi:hypothetical protein
MYVKKHRRRALSGFSGLGYSDEDQCSVIPLNDPYRKPGNYCATPEGGSTTFNSDGSTYRAPGAVDPDPAHPAGSKSGGGFWEQLISAVAPKPPTTVITPAAGGISTTTAILLGGGALAAVYLLTR